MAASYIVTDRTTAVKQAIQVDDGILFIEETVSAASAEPIVTDNTDAGNYWKIFVSDGVIGIESTVTVQDDSVLLDDITTSEIWQLIVDAGILGIESTTAPIVIGRFKVQKATFNPLVVKSSFVRQTVKI